MGEATSKTKGFTDPTLNDTADTASEKDYLDFSALGPDGCAFFFLQRGGFDFGMEYEARYEVLFRCASWYGQPGGSCKGRPAGKKAAVRLGLALQPAEHSLTRKAGGVLLEPSCRYLVEHSPLYRHFAFRRVLPKIPRELYILELRQVPSILLIGREPEK